MGTGDRIREIREKRKMSAEELGQKIGVVKTTIIRYEKGDIAKIPYFNFLKILIALETTPEEILSEEELKLVWETDELRGMYRAIGEAQQTMVKWMTNLEPAEVDVVDAVVQSLVARHKE